MHKTGLQRYHYKLLDDNELILEEDGFSYYPSVGIEYRFSAMSLLINYRHLDMGDNIVTDTLGCGIAYRF
ncbi:hypothetical protein [Agaribacter marinus]|uniref:Uncharacterized protein n=1 Tax=Agaribacter marinus TaxID=1431249 RepID=A0AA37WJS6_9ALTE|nr:hypothetical protein [Agaribacter marinus]GLR70564.1 hypothetical protein GCM10007852_14720 [Agaribacter marinus]